MKVFITGGSGYVGAMLADQFASRPDVEAILLIDKDPLSDLSEIHADKSKISFIQANLADDGWQEKVKHFAPDVIIHTAWQIREMYGKRDVQWKWNIVGSDHVFDLAFSLPSVKKLIYFSTVASYGAYPSNRLDHFFSEEEPFRKTDYLYAEEKRIVESRLKEKYEEVKKAGKLGLQTVIIRPASITGPRGRNRQKNFSLQSALSGKLKGQKSFLYDFISLWVSWMPATKKWLRQYIHEDDVADIINFFAFNEVKGDYEIFNIGPADVVHGEDMAKAVGKKVLPVQPWMVRLSFFVMWHLTRGRVPTAPGVWKGYSYPIPIDASKLTRYGYQYRYTSKDAFTKAEGRYLKDLPNPPKSL